MKTYILMILAFLSVHLCALPPTFPGVSKTYDGDIVVPVTKDWVCSQKMVRLDDQSNPDSIKYLNISISDQLSPYSGNYVWSYYQALTLSKVILSLNAKTLPVHLSFRAWDYPQKRGTIRINGVPIVSYSNGTKNSFQKLFLAEINDGTFALCWKSRKQPKYGEDIAIISILLRSLVENRLLTMNATAKFTVVNASEYPNDLKEAVRMLDNITNDKEKEVIRNSSGIEVFLSMGHLDFGMQPTVYPGTRDISSKIQDIWGLNIGNSPIAKCIKNLGIRDPEQQSIFILWLYRLHLNRAEGDIKLIVREINTAMQKLKKTIVIEN
jgi:hypothetical protein